MASVARDMLGCWKRRPVLSYLCLSKDSSTWVEREREGVLHDFVQAVCRTIRPVQVGAQKKQKGRRHNPDREKG